MSDLAVIVPSRERPHNIGRLVQSWHDTGAVAHLVVSVDVDDPTLDGYIDLRQSIPGQLLIGDRLGMAGTLNKRAVVAARTCRHVGFMGDDHVPRTAGWDRTFIEALDDLGTGIVYGHDLLQGANLPTAVFVSSDIVNTLGYLCFPGARHMYLDDCWKRWGEGIGRLRYLPDVVIEHMHPGAGKAPHDSSYGETGQLMGPDAVAWDAYQANGLEADLNKLRGIL